MHRHRSAGRGIGHRYVGLLTTTMSVMKDVVDQVNEKVLSGKIKTIVGGAPVTADFAQDIGADSFGFDGVSAVEEIKRLCHVS